MHRLKAKIIFCNIFLSQVSHGKIAKYVGFTWSPSWLSTSFWPSQHVTTTIWAVINCNEGWCFFIVRKVLPFFNEGMISWEILDPNQAEVKACKRRSWVGFVEVGCVAGSGPRPNAHLLECCLVLHHPFDLPMWGNYNSILLTFVLTLCVDDRNISDTGSTTEIL